MKLEDMAWNNFYKTGDVESYLEYKRIMDIDANKQEYLYQNNDNQIIQNLGVMINEINKDEGNSDKGSTI